MRAAAFAAAAAVTLAACAKPSPALEMRGALPPGGAIVVHDVMGRIEVYGPLANDPAREFTVDYFGARENAPRIAASGNVVAVTPRAFERTDRYLIRAPKDTTLDLSTQQGSISVEDVDAVVNAQTKSGAINVMVPQYANARSQAGNVQVTMGSTQWAGTLRFATERGDVTLYVNALANAHVFLHTANGSIFTDFPLRGTSKGTSETIDGILNAGGSRSIDVRVGSGAIRLLQLKPQP